MPDNINPIKDIGSAQEKWLNQQGIETYDNLAAADPNRIVEQLAQKNTTPVALAKTQGGMKAAKRLTAVASPPGSPIAAQPTALQNRSLITEEDGWAEFASFYISYQRKHTEEQPGLRTQVVYRTYADHIEANDNQQWDGIEGDYLCDWIMKHVETIMNDNTEAEPSAETAIKPNSIRIESIRVHDPIGGTALATAGELFKGVVYAQQPLSFDFNLEYQISDGNATSGTHIWDCKLSLYIYNRQGDKLVLKPEKTCHQLLSLGQTQGFEVIVIPELPAGLYRIRAIATLMTKTPVLTVINIPLLQVI